jgi:cellulose synthase/poly-beta-1,6-N-acetylglucosamine synthase-like glycosyltransferase
VVIPAHNEAATLPATLASLAALDYPRSQYELLVVADNCEDETEAVARAGGARVLVRTDPARRGKGQALAWVFARLLEERGHDAFAVLDADTRPAPDLLTHFDAALQRGAGVVNARCAVGNVGESWRTAMMTADMALVYHLRPAGRQALGASVDVQGPVCLTPAVLRQVPWETTSVTEDREYHLRLVLRGLRSVFAPRAVVYTVMEPTMAAARHQELRWEGGRLALARRYLGPLLCAAWRRGGTTGWWPYVDTAVELAVPPFSLLAAGTAAMFALHALAYTVASGPGVLAVLWAALLAGQAFYVFAGCALARVPARAYAALFVYGPLYAVAKVACYVAVVRTGARAWVPTTRRPPSTGSATCGTPTHRAGESEAG